MEAKRIPGKKGRSKAMRISALPTEAVKEGDIPLVAWHEVMAILQSPDEPDEEDVVEVRMSLTEARGTLAWLRGHKPQLEIARQLEEVLGGSPLPE